MPRACAFFQYASYFSVCISRPNLCSEHYTYSPHTLPKYTLQSIHHPLTRLVFKTLQRVLIVLRIKSKILTMPTAACVTGCHLLLGPHLLSLCPCSFPFGRGPALSPLRASKSPFPLSVMIQVSYPSEPSSNAAFSRGPSLAP